MGGVRPRCLPICGGPMWRSVDRASVGHRRSVDWAWAGPTGRLTPRNNRPDYRGSHPLANGASGVEWPPRDLGRVEGVATHRHKRCFERTGDRRFSSSSRPKRINSCLARKRSPCGRECRRRVRCDERAPTPGCFDEMRVLAPTSSVDVSSPLERIEPGVQGSIPQGLPTAPIRPRQHALTKSAGSRLGRAM
jgi:hypothetical protein